MNNCTNLRSWGMMGPHHRYRQEIPEPALSNIQAWCSNWGYSDFPAIKITAIHQVRMYCSLSVKINMWEKRHGLAKIVDAFCLPLFPCVVSKNSNTSNWRSMAEDAITLGGIGVLESPVYICDPHLNVPSWFCFIFPICKEIMLKIGFCIRYSSLNHACIFRSKLKIKNPVGNICFCNTNDFFSFLLFLLYRKC